jgi:hypothetical protein
MCKQVVGPPWIGKLMDSITSNTYVKHFLLGNNIIDRTGAEAIANFIRLQRQPIETWYIAGNKIDGEGMRLIADALSADQCAKALWLKRNPLGVDGVKAVADMLVENRSVEILDLNNVGMLDEGCEYLFDKLTHNTTLKLLYMDANALTVRSCVAIKKYFKTMADRGLVGITSLFMGMNPLKNAGVRELGKGFVHYKSLERLCVSSSRFTTEGLVDLLDPLLSSPLLHLDVGHYKATADMHELSNCFDVVGAEVLGKFAASHPTLQILDCRTVHFDTEALDALGAALRHNTRMLYVYPEQYGLRTKESRAALKVIREICYRNCKIHGYAGLQDFCTNHLRFLKHTPRVRDIDSIYRNNM